MHRILNNKMITYLKSTLFQFNLMKKFLLFIIVLLTINIIKLNTVESAGYYSSNGAITLSSSREEKLKKINDISSPNRTMRELIVFLNKIDGFDSKKLCSSLIRSDVQAKLSRFKSIISTCPGPGFCRLAMRQNGSVFGTSDAKLETIFNLTQVSDRLLLKEPALLGANYIMFISAGKYLCIDSHSRLVASTVKTKECLWFTNSKPITSASNRSVKLIIQKTQKMCRIITLITKNVDNNPHLDLCRNQIKIETTYPADLHRIKSNCIKINQNDDNFLLKHKLSITNMNKKYTTKQFLSSITTTSTTTTTTVPIAMKPARNSLFFKKLLTKSNGNQQQQQQNKIKINKYATLVTEIIRQLCTDYLKEELIYKKNSVEYHYIIRLNSQEDEAEDLAEIPKLCADYLMNSNKTDIFIQELKNELSNTKHRDSEKNSAEYNYYMNSNENHLLKSTSSSASSSTNTKFKRCYAYRNKPEYKQCMRKYYRCHQYNNDIENLKKCRIKYGVTLPTKLI